MVRRNQNNNWLRAHRWTGATTGREVTSGVPQGSILGPMLFLLYVKKLPKAVKTSKVVCFADDTKVLKQIDNIQDSVGLQNDINNLNIWARDNGLTFNQMKCKCQRITRKKTPVQHPYALNELELETLHEEKDLGVWVSSELSWKKQVIELSSKTNKLMGFERRSSREIRNERTRRCLFLTIVRPHLGYATQIWAPQAIELIKRVERVQRRATKCILNLPYHCEVTYEDRLQATNLLPVCFWHEYLDLTFFCKMVNGMVCVSEEIIPERKLACKRITRATSNPDTIMFKTRKCNTTTFQGSFVNRTLRIWNILLDELRH